jgi:hypothetical protein
MFRPFFTLPYGTFPLRLPYTLTSTETNPKKCEPLLITSTKSNPTTMPIWGGIGGFSYLPNPNKQ